MLLQNSPTLENIVVRLLRESPSGRGAMELRALVSKEWKEYSRRGIYKELQRLEREGVIMRSGPRYMLRLAWVLALHAETQQLLSDVSAPQILQESLPKRGEDLVIYCTDLVRWDRIWTQLMLMLHTIFPKLPMFIWAPRHWFTLTHPEIEVTFTRALEAGGNLRYAVIGGRGPLDRRDRPIIARKSTAYTFRLSPFEHDRNHYRSIVGDYMLTCTLDQRTAQEIDSIYEKIKRLNDLPADTRTRLLSSKRRLSLRFAWAPEQAEAYRRKFLKLFGLQLRPDGTLLEVLRGER